jgi:hypothetical protein
MLALYALAAVTAAYGDDASPAGKAAVRDLVDVGAAFCAASYVEDGKFEPEDILRPRGFLLPGERIDGTGASANVFYLEWRRLDRSLTVTVRIVDGQETSCTVKSPLKVWERMIPAMPAFAKAARLPLVQGKAYNHIWRGGGMQATARQDYGGTVLILERAKP